MSCTGQGKKCAEALNVSPDFTVLWRLPVCLVKFIPEKSPLNRAESTPGLSKALLGACSASQNRGGSGEGLCSSFILLFVSPFGFDSPQEGCSAGEGEFLVCPDALHAG